MSDPASIRSLLVMAHPGHELRIFHWAEQRHPPVFILTDGSGAEGEGRIAETEDLFRAIHARRAGWMQLLPDNDVYRLILEGDIEPFASRTRELADYIVSHEIEEIAGDMIEGYNPSHDLCRNCINFAVKLAAKRGHKTRRNLAFPLIGNPVVAGNIRPVELLKLDAAALDRKYGTATKYQALRHEVEAAVRMSGKEAFAIEAFYDADALGDAPPEIPPYYEKSGEKRVAAGRYRQVIRFREHVQPMIDSLRSALGLPA